MDAKEMAGLLYNIGAAKRSALPDPSTLSDAQLISEFTETYKLGTTV
jgi:hypothetical protein